MSLVSLVLTLGVVGALLWFINKFLPGTGKTPIVLNTVVVVALIVWMLYSTGLFGLSGRI